MLEREVVFLEDKKQDVLEAAKKIFAQYGYNKTTMNDIGRTVGLNKASLYYHYKCKLDLYKAVVKSLRDEHSFEVMQRLEQLTCYKDKIMFFVLKEIDFGQSLATIFNNDLSALDYKSQEMKTVYYEIVNEDIEKVAEFIRQGIMNGEFISYDECLIAKAIVNSVDAILNNQCPLEMMGEERAKGYLDIKEQVEILLNLIMNGIKVQK